MVSVLTVLKLNVSNKSDCKQADVVMDFNNVMIFILRFFLSITSLLFSVQLTCAQPADVKILMRINPDGDARGDNAFKAISNSVIPISLAMPVSLFATGYFEKDRELKKKSYVAAASLATAAAVTITLKYSTKRARPYETYPDLINAKVHEDSYSFPSGHTAAAFSTATSLSLAFPRWYVIAPSCIYAGAVGYSRMYLGVHYPSDVIGGALVGAGSAFLCYKAQKWFNKKQGKH